MRFTTRIAAVAAVLACDVRLAAAEGEGYIFKFSSKLHSENGGRAGLRTNTVSAETAQIILAQRIGVEDYHTTHGLTADDISSINFHGHKTPFFGSDAAPRRALLLGPVDDIDNLDQHFSKPDIITISGSPSYAAAEELWEDFLVQLELRGLNSDYLRDASSLRALPSNTPWLHIEDDTDKTFERARQLERDGVEVTMALMPKKENGQVWKPYEMPGTASLLKRQISNRIEERPLSVSEQNSPAAHTMQVMASNSSSNYSNNKPLEGILPACFSSQRTCESRTRGCTGHGSCKLKYTNSLGDKEAECWSCACKATKSNSLTTHWTGPACQKKDISVEFWLIALFTIGLMSFIGFAVGSIWSMGEEELPSVIGAGVSGPTARK